MLSSEITILVTGFGPFGNHERNASWEAVERLSEMREYLREKRNVKLVIDHIPVVYDHVLDRVPRLWKEHDPRIVLHVGVSRNAKCLTIEKKASGVGYVRPDVNNKCPAENRDDSSSSILQTGINVEELCRKINEKNCSDDTCKACISNDAGRYLCEYIYYRSLCENANRVLFIHVPDFHVYSSELTAKGLCEIIELLVENL